MSHIYSSFFLGGGGGEAVNTNITTCLGVPSVSPCICKTILMMDDLLSILSNQMASGKLIRVI